MVGKEIGNYRVVRQLGEGGMGVVYEAVHRDIGGRAAVKVLRREFALHAETATRFFNEARAANLIDHPSIVKIFDYGQLADGAPYLAMELLTGESLHHRLLRERRLSEPDSLRLGRQVATALAAAHDKAVIHRDLKPENIFIVPDVEASGGERAKILDFGIAKLAPGKPGNLSTATNVVMGTPIYMSPEQCKGGKHVDERADIYALGIILFEMLAGRPPFIAEEAGEYIGMHLFKEPPPLGSLVPSVSQGLQRLVDSMLTKDPAKRPSAKVVTAVLKSLGNLTSDVISRQAVAAEKSARLDIPEALRPTDPAPLSAPLSAPLLAPAPAPLWAPPPATVRRPPPSENQPAALGSAAVSSGPEEPTALMSAGKVAALRESGRAGLPDEWQPVVVSAATPNLGSLELDSGNFTFVEKPKPAPWLKRLRRLRYRVKKRVLLWLGFTISDPRTTPSELRQADLRIAGGIGIAALVLIGILLLVKLGRKPAEPPPYPTPQQPVVEVVKPPLPPPPPPKEDTGPPPPARLIAALTLAQQLADKGNWYGAMKAARDAAKKDPHPVAFTASGKYACQLGRQDRVDEARAHLSDDSLASRQGNAAVTQACAEVSQRKSLKSR